jgi:Aspartyl protease
MEGGEMLKCSGLPCIELHVSGGHHLKMLIDTGNVNSTLDKTTAMRLGLALSPVNGSDAKPIPDYALATLRNSWAGNASLGDIKVLVVDLKSDISKGTAPEADGTIAYTALPDKLLVLDYEHRKFAITKAPQEDMPCPNLCGKVSNPTFGVDGPPIVVTTGFTLNGMALVMQVDTLWSGTMLIYDGAAVRLGLSQAIVMSLPKERSFPFTDGGVQMIETRSDTQGFEGTVLNRNAPFYLPTKAVHQPDGLFDGTVGNELFDHHVLRIDFASHQFSIT